MEHQPAHSHVSDFPVVHIPTAKSSRTRSTVVQPFLIQLPYVRSPVAQRVPQVRASLRAHEPAWPRRSMLTPALVCAGSLSDDGFSLLSVRILWPLCQQAPQVMRDGFDVDGATGTRAALYAIV